MNEIATSTSMVDMFREGGVFMYIILALTLLNLVLAVPTFIVLVGSAAKPALKGPAIGLGIAMVLFSSLVLLVAVGGWQLGLSQMNAALSAASPETAAALEMRGREIAAIPLWFGVLTAPLPLLLGIVSAGRGFSMAGRT